MHRLNLSVALTLVVALAPSAAFAQDETKSLSEQGRELVEDYIARFKAKDAKGALEAHWSFASLCAGIFGEDWGPLSDADKQTCQQGLEDLLAPAFSNPQLVDLMASATYSEPEAGEPVDGVVEVTFVLEHAERGMPPTPQFFWIALVDGQPKIVDMARQSREQALTKAVGAQWRGVKQQQPELTPMDYVRMMAGG